jgi:hypothetical protein
LVPPPADARLPDAELDDAGLPIIHGDGGDSEIEMDPATAEDPDPAAKGSAAKPQDEEEHAPQSAKEVEARAPKTPVLAQNLPEALRLIKDGKRDLAVASLRSLRTKNPKSAYIPFLLGNLYFSQRWWSVAMDDYADAIKKNPDFRGNPTVNKNVIAMLGSPKTRGKATYFLRNTIGHYAAPYIRYAADHEPNDAIRKQAAYLRRYIR